MANRSLQRPFWRVTDALDYVLILTRMRILDALADVQRETPLISVGSGAAMHANSDTDSSEILYGRFP